MILGFCVRGRHIYHALDRTLPGDNLVFPTISTPGCQEELTVKDYIQEGGNLIIYDTSPSS